MVLFDFDGNGQLDPADIALSLALLEEEEKEEKSDGYDEEEEDEGEW